MTYTDWAMVGTEFANCNCHTGCPCQFNSLPTHGHCRAHTFVQIDRGHFGTTRLDGLAWGFLVKWPGPVHKGQGVMRIVIDDRANDAQRLAIDTIARGKETEPGTLVTQVFSTTIVEYLPTVYRPITMTLDLPARHATLHVPDVIESSAGPIKNQVTGAAHRARVVLPNGFEYTEAEFAAGTSRAVGTIDLDFRDTHAHLAPIHWTTSGVVR